jgi:hypothetical protein
LRHLVIVAQMGVNKADQLRPYFTLLKQGLPGISGGV